MSYDSRAFARLYDARFSGYARSVGHKIIEFYEDRVSRSPDSVLDLCCGTGQLASLFLKRGYFVTGVDKSPQMLGFAKSNNEPFVEKGQARFIESDITNFKIEGNFGLVVATNNAVNLLGSIEEVRKCLRTIFPVLRDDGFLIFDLSTGSNGLYWNDIVVEEWPNGLTVTRSIYDQSTNKAYSKTSGFVRTEGEFFERVSNTITTTFFKLVDIENLLNGEGWEEVYFTSRNDLDKRLDDPESETGVFVIARK